MNHRQAGRENLCNRFGINRNEFLERDLVVYNPATLAIYTNQAMTLPTGYVEIKLPVDIIRALDVPGLAPGTEAKYAFGDDGLH